MTVAAIHQPQYLPYLPFFHKVAQADVFVVLDNVQFLHRSEQHRNRIKTERGWQWITVPVHTRRDQLISEVVINQTEPWQRRHTNAIRSSYGRAPYFDEYAPRVLELIAEPRTSLADLNMSLVTALMEMLKIETPVVYASSLGVDGHRSQRLANLCVAVGADTYLSGPGGASYMDQSVFDAARVEVSWQDFEPPAYPQLFPEVGFVPGLSILDTILCLGPETARSVERP